MMTGKLLAVASTSMSSAPVISVPHEKWSSLSREHVSHTKKQECRSALLFFLDAPQRVYTMVSLSTNHF